MRKLRSYLPVLSWMAFMTYMLLLRADRVPDILKDTNDKSIHLLIFAFTALLFYLAEWNYSFVNTYPIWRWLLPLLLVYSIGVELIQEYMIDGRRGSMWDVLANMGGATIVVIFLELLRLKKTRHNK